MLLTCCSMKWIRNVSQAGEVDSSCCNVQMTGNICCSIKSTVYSTIICSGLWFLYSIISSLFLKFPRAKNFHLSLSNQDFTHFKSLYKSLSSLWYCRKSSPPTSSFCQKKCYIHPYCHWMKTWWITAFLFTFSFCMLVSESFMCVHVVFCDTTVWLVWMRKMQFYFNGHLRV